PVLKERAEKWLKEPGAANTPEAAAVRWMLIETNMELAGAAKTREAKTPLWNEAKEQCKALEHAENEYTDKARKVKFAIIQEEGGLDNDIKTLATFDDCYVRAQYEGYLLEEAAKKNSDSAAFDKERAKHLEAIEAALKRGFELVDKRKLKVPEED